jgi:dUTP pyrophosphatase
MTDKLLVKRLNADAILPTRGSRYAAGLDLYASETTCIATQCLNESGGLVSTGISMVIPHGYYGRIAPRSGFSVKYGLVINAGVIDSDYRGEIKILFNNFTKSNVVINKGDKIAQIIIEKISLLDVEEVDDLEDTERGDKGFGSTDLV